MIPAGTYVKGKIAQVKRAGKIKGRAEILFNFTTMIFPNGYTIDLPGALENAPGSRNSTVADKEGTVKADSQKGKDAGTVAKTGATGAVIGAVATGGKAQALVASLALLSVWGRCYLLVARMCVLTRILLLKWCWNVRSRLM